MAFWIAIVLGLVQGFTEFLPVSSSGHLVLLEKFFDVTLDYTFLNVVLHFATLLAVCWFYRIRLWNLVKHPLSKQMQYLVIATIPAVIFVLLCNNFVESNLSSLTFVGIGFLLTAVLLIVAEIVSKKTLNHTNINYLNSAVIGVAQALAIFPGLSRSGTTLAFGLMSGVNKEEALDFSFLMSIPIILGSLVYEIISKNAFATSLTSADVLPIILGFAIAFFTALLSIKLMQNVMKKSKLFWFVPYLVVLGVLTLIYA